MEAASIITNLPSVPRPRPELLAGARAVAPIAVAAAVFGASFGILARDAGMGTVAPIVMSVTTFAGSAQFAVASVLESGGAVAAAVVAAILLNLRYLAVGVSVAPSLRGSRARRLAEAQLATDESWAVAQVRGRVDRDRLIGAAINAVVLPVHHHVALPIAAANVAVAVWAQHAAIGHQQHRVGGRLRFVMALQHQPGACA